ncbi:hypothetical protein [Xenorhabdus doucetiae]|uniref:Uncharacterized protein n=1 Tax=Xenorhabdus doucetiae TaxID=351671 RepID=A0A068QRH3_9GAMM|nr:hypothetical protein [Xenorhabdus doucetiae]TYO95195.1 hypothetical protein LY16_03547 [Xenorhabdus doucetiae]CDG17637.1 protein of unknown function [Xenorhabdus doucetiae]
MAINQIAKIGLSSLQVIYYFENLFNLDKYFYDHHFGGTAHPAQSIPEGLSEFYFEFDESLGDPNIGGDGVAQIGLLTNKIHWACG